jgi:hypothetical protein
LTRKSNRESGASSGVSCAIYLEQFNTGRILPAGKYQVTRALATAKPSKLLAA